MASLADGAAAGAGAGAGRRRGRCLGVVLGLLLLGRLVRVLLVLVVADRAGRAGDDCGGRGRPHEAGASASHHGA